MAALLVVVVLGVSSCDDDDTTGFAPLPVVGATTKNFTHTCN